jgi:hypothetical protein
MADNRALRLRGSYGDRLRLVGYPGLGAAMLRHRRLLGSSVLPTPAGRFPSCLAPMAAMPCSEGTFSYIGQAGREVNP